MNRRGPLVFGAVLALALAAAPAAAEAQLLGRLFLSPQEREALDKQRYATPAPAARQEPAATEAEAPPPPPPPPLPALRLEGLVVRSAGPNTAWLDGAPVIRPGSTPAGVTVDPGAGPGGGVTLTVPGMDGPISLKPGQQFDPATARVTEFRPPPPARPEGGGNGEDAPAAGSGGGDEGPTRDDRADPPGDAVVPDHPGEAPAAP